MNLQENIRRILREKLTARIRRRIPYDEMENEFFESFDSAYNLTKRKKLFLDELIYTTITMMMDGVHWRFVSTLPEDEFWYDDIHKELENHYRDRITQMYNERRGIQESILRENDFSPAGKEVTPNKIVVHKSNPMFRDKILQDGLKVKAGECYKIYVGDGTKCKPAIFATNSTNKRVWFDSTYDDDIWEINTEMIPNVRWFKDKNYDSKSKHIVTFQDIPREAITLKYEGSGSGDAEKWDKNSPNLFESIRRILREEIEFNYTQDFFDYHKKENLPYHSKYKRGESIDYYKKHFIDEVKKYIVEDNQILLYRVVTTKKEKDIKKPFGIYWAFKKEDSQVIDWENIKDTDDLKLFRITALFDLSDINWKDSFDLYLMNDFMESEIRVKDGANPEKYFIEEL
jgi:hypothetical protein